MNQPPSAIQVSCPQCQATLSFPRAAAHTTVTCSNCLEDFVATPTTETSSSAVGSSGGDDDALRRLLNPHFDRSSADSEKIRLDGDLDSDEYPVKKKVRVLESGYEFSVTCMVCGTRLDVNDALIGKKVKCPDCHSGIEVRTPPPDRRRAPVHPTESARDDDDYGLSAAANPAVASSPFHSIANDLIANAEKEVAKETPIAPRKQQIPALDALQRAEDSQKATDEQERPNLPAAPFRTGVLKFLIDPLTIARLLVLGLVFFVELEAIQASITTAEGGPQAQFMSVLSRMFAITLGAVFVTNLSVSLLGILQDTANGKDAIESWPDVNFLDWLGEALYVFSGLFMAVFPACALAKVVSLVGAPDVVFWAISIGGSSLGILILFPFLLVSMLESGSPIMPVSQPILRSLRLARSSWVAFTMLSVLVIGAGLCLGAVRVLWSDSAMMNLLVAVLWIVVVALYFRLLGRLTWCCDEAVLAEDIRLEQTSEAAHKSA
ncbi:MAG: hypothetical protein H6822_10915 [Planctomycetaceae bacterium]|nr:hypothetical protein [Planctomycetales bacterium]MCB9922685.1 hypothetical protein [Planctomycetaceae bacterium]